MSLDQHHHICQDRKPQPASITSSLWTRRQPKDQSRTRAALQEVHKVAPKSELFCRWYLQLFETSDSGYSRRSEECFILKAVSCFSQTLSLHNGGYYYQFPKTDLHLICENKLVSFMLTASWSTLLTEIISAAVINKEESYQFHTEADNAFKQHMNADGRGREWKAASNYKSSREECSHTNTRTAYIENGLGKWIHHLAGTYPWNSFYTRGFFSN